jgi:tripartite-type tricarboxylate transporter receptor subunit TctC
MAAQLRYIAGTIAVLLVAVGCVPVAIAQSFPNKTIRLTIPFPPSGASDILARSIADKLTESLKQRVIVDNRPGGGGLISIELVAHSPADGYSLLQIATSFVINPSLYKKLPYDAKSDFTPIALLAVADNILVAHPSLPVKSPTELIALARARPGELNYAHTGYGTQAFLGAELFKQVVGVDMLPIAYKGTPAALLELISGQVHLMFAGAPPALPQIQSGRLRAIAVTGKERLPELPAVPALAETLPGFEASVWYGLLAPAGTPGEIVTRLSVEVNKALRLPAIREQLGKHGFRLFSATPQEFAAYMNAEGDKWAKVIRRSGVSAGN